MYWRSSSQVNFPIPACHWHCSHLSWHAYLLLEFFLLGLLTCHSKSTYSHRGCILWSTSWHSWCENSINDFYCVYFFGLGLWMGCLIGARRGCCLQPFAVGNVLYQAALQMHTMRRLNSVLRCSEWWTLVLISTSCADKDVKINNDL